MHKVLAVTTMLVLAVSLPLSAAASGEKQSKISGRSVEQKVLRKHKMMNKKSAQPLQIRLRIMEVRYPAPRKDLEGQPHVQKKYPWELRVCPTVVS
jgi:hypothetical protein